MGNELGAQLRAAREAAGYSLAALAEATHHSKAALGHYETGRRPVTAAVVAAYERALHVRLDAGPWVADPVREALAWLTEPHPAADHLRAGCRVGAGLSSEITGRVQRLRLADDITPGRVLYPHVLAERSRLAHVLAQASAAPNTRAEMLTALAELEQLAGWIAADGGAHAQAQAHYLSGVEAATAAGDSVTAAQLWSCLAYMLTGRGAAADGLLLARTARTGARHPSPLVACLLAERHAFAAAVATDARACQAALGDAQAFLESASPDIPEPAWVYWLNGAEVAVMAGRCLVMLGQPQQAVPLLSGAIDSYPADHAREVALYRGWLATAHAAAGDLDAARAQADAAAVTAGAAGVDSDRVVTQLDIVSATSV